MDPMGMNLKAERSWEILEKSVYTVGRHETADFQLQGEFLWPSLERSWQLAVDV